MASLVTIHNPIHKFTALDDFQVLLHLETLPALPAFHHGHLACTDSWSCGYRYAATFPGPSSDQPYPCSRAKYSGCAAGCEVRSVVPSQEQLRRLLLPAVDDPSR